MRSSLELIFSSFTSLRSSSSWFEAYAAFSTFLMLLRTAINDLLPLPVRSFIISKLEALFSRAKPNHHVTIQINQFWDRQINGLFQAATEYLPTRITHTFQSLKVGKLEHNNTLLMAVDGKKVVVDEFEDIKLDWKLMEKSESKDGSEPREKNKLILSFDQKHREKVMKKYLPHVLSTYKAMKAEQRTLRIHYLSFQKWEKREFTHPATFETLAFDPELKQSIIDDMERFLKRKELYKRVGKPWKRGYLLYGPPGTGKSSLIAAMANFLKFDVYDLELSRVFSNSELMKAIRDISNRSIVVIEDIDCNELVLDRCLVKNPPKGSCDSDIKRPRVEKLTLSGLLNYIDGLWSSSGEERILVFTTNHIERIDPALLRPGRMDMHIHLSFCKAKAFRVLASNYLDIQGHHPLFEQIEGLLEKTEVTPAVVAEQLLRSEDPEVALEEFIKFLQDKNTGSEAQKLTEERMVDFALDTEKTTLCCF